MTKKILYLCHRIPYPPNKGDKIRSFNEIKYLSKSYTIDLITLADEPNDLKYIENLQEYCRKLKIFPLNKSIAKIKGFLSLMTGKSISQGYFYNKRFQHTLNQWYLSENYDAVFCFSSPMAEYIFKTEKHQNNVKKYIMDFCDLDSDKWSQYAEKCSFPMNLLYKIEAQRLLKFEIKINQEFNTSIFVSDNEKDLFLQYFPGGRNIHVISNGVDYMFFNQDVVKTDKKFSHPMIMFSGAMDYYANVDGITWFVEKIFPLIKEKVPNIKFYIVGSNPGSEVKALEKDPSVVVTGYVEDIREYYKAADLCVIPLRIARGVQNKVLEAMAMAKGIVSTSHAVQGIIPEVKKIIEIEDTPVQFAEKAIHLICNNNEQNKLGREARQFVTCNYNWERNIKHLGALASL